MVKILFFCQRRPGLTHAQYGKRLLEGHLPLALQHHRTLRKYVVNMVENRTQDAGAIDSINVLYFDSVRVYREELYDSPEGKEHINRDVAGFLRSTHGYVTRERVHKAEVHPLPTGQRSPGFKWIRPLSRRADVTHSEFVEHWLDNHIPLILKHQPTVSRLVTNIVDERLFGSGPDWDLIAELYCPEQQSPAEPIIDSVEAERILHNDLARFVDQQVSYITTEHIQHAPE
jgi:uncharacterized protein (TIGR02118 family)